MNRFLARLVKTGQVPKRSRLSSGKSAFNESPQWLSLKKLLDEGIPAGESALVPITTKDWEEMGLSSRPVDTDRRVAMGSKTAKAYVREYLLSLGPAYAKYQVSCYHVDCAECYLSGHTGIICHHAGKTDADILRVDRKNARRAA